MPTPSSLLIVGTDTVLGAAPSTAVQLTHACIAAGFDAVIPASWGDELIAARVLERIDSADGPIVQCTCPLVANRLAPHGESIAAMTVCTLSPPVATARYLRELYEPERPRITYAGACRGGHDDAIDAVLSPRELFDLLSERGVGLASQPREFDAMLAPDRRRFFSDPGGAPAAALLRQRDVGCVEVTAEGFVTELAQHLLGRLPLLIDASGAMGCVCAGAVMGSDTAREARSRLREIEPPRSPGPVLDEGVRVNVDKALPEFAKSNDVAAPADPGAEAADTQAEPVAVAADAPRRRSPIGTRKSVLGAMPQARTDAGRQLPRAYVARRRSSPKGVRAQRPLDASASPLGGRWPYVAAAGVAVGVALAWLAGLLR